MVVDIILSPHFASYLFPNGYSAIMRRPWRNTTVWPLIVSTFLFSKVILRSCGRPWLIILHELFLLGELAFRKRASAREALDEEEERSLFTDCMSTQDWHHEGDGMGGGGRGVGRTPYKYVECYSHITFLNVMKEIESASWRWQNPEINSSAIEWGPCEFRQRLIFSLEMKVMNCITCIIQLCVIRLWLVNVAFITA